MLSLRSLLLLTLPLLAVLAQQDSESDSSATAEWEETLRALPGESVALALEQNLKPQYQGGIFEDGYSALRAVRSDDPQLASKLVDLARQDADVKQYLKRQSNNSSTSSTTPSSTTSDVPESTTTATTLSSESSPSGQSPSTSETSTPNVASSTPSPTGEPTSPPGETPAPSSNFGSSSMTPDTSTSRSATSSSMNTSRTPSSSSVLEVSSTLSSSSPSGISSSSQEESSPQSVPVPPTSATSEPTPEASNTRSVLVTTTILTSTQTGVLVPIPVTSTSDGSIVESTSVAFLPSAPTSVAVAVTSNGVISTSMAPAIIQTSTDSQGSVRTTAIPLTSVAVAPGGSILEGPVATSTDEGGNVVTVTYRPDGGTVSRLELLTTTLSGGMQTVITSFAEVGGGTSTIGADGSDGPQSTDQPDLQSGAATPSSWYAAEVAMVVGAAIGVAGLVL